MLRQRTWVIYTRPYWTHKGDLKIFYTGQPKVGTVADMGYTGTDSSTFIKVFRASVSLPDPQMGTWVESCRSHSIKEIKEMYEEISQEVPKEHIRVCEEIPFEIDSIPIS